MLLKKRTSLRKLITSPVNMAVYCLVFLAACSDIGDRDNPYDIHGTTFEDFWGFNDEDGVIDSSSSNAEDVFPYSSAGNMSIVGKPTSSASRDPFNIVDKPTSSATIIDDPNTPTPSSSSVEIVTGLGSCKPAVSPIDKGTSAMWVFTPNPDLPKEMLMKFAQKDAYAWDFGGLTDDGSASGRNSGKVTYTESGKYTASVTVTIDGSAETKICSELQVNGDPITGCKCAPVGVTGSIDYTATPDVSWTVTGCTSASLPLTYAWDGGAAGAEMTFTKTFTAATVSYAPILKVGNSDNTEIDVECPAVKVVAPWKKCGDALVRDEVSYNTVVIKDRCWTKENMLYEPTAGYTMCYGGESTNCEIYGRLYDYEAASLACPSGWRLPTSDEFVELQEYSGEDMYDAGAWFKAANGWTGENGNDELGFSALPGGRCDYAQTCNGLGERGYWWTSTEVVKNASHYTLFLNSDGSTFSATTKMDDADYASVRCVKIE